MFYYFKEVKTQDDGTFSLAGIPPGQYTVQPKFPAAFPYCESSAVSAAVKSGETAREKVVLAPAVKLQGKVADRATSKGVAGARVALFGDSAVASREAVTDAKGAFTIYVKPGTTRLYVWQAPEPYIASGMMQDMATLNAAEGVAVPTIFLDRTMPVEALVVDPAGQPIADAEIRIASQFGKRAGRGFSESPAPRCRRQGCLGQFLDEADRGNSRPREKRRCSDENDLRGKAEGAGSFAAFR